jgi:nucleoside-diphosphate-sugar epimerase
LNFLVGATGFVGSHVIEYLFQQNELSKGIFRKGAHLKIMDLNGVQGVEADILDHHSLHEAMEGVDTVYSMASPMPDRDQDFLRVNTEGIANLLEVSQEAKVKSFVHLSTLDVYGFRSGGIGPDSTPRPSGDYQEAKFQADRTLLEFAKRNPSPRITILRAARAVGSRDESFTTPLLRMIMAGSAVLPASATMSFSHPKDIAEAMYRAATNPNLGKAVYLIKSFDSEPGTLASTLAAAVGTSAAIKKEGMLAKSQLPPYARDQLRAHLKLDSQDGWNELDYAPKYDLRATCNEIAEWYKRDPWATERD